MSSLPPASSRAASRRAARLLAALALHGLTACHDGGARAAQAAADARVQEAPVEEPDAALPVAEDAAQTQASNLPALCSRRRADAVRDVFCAEGRAPIRGLRELQAALGFNAVPLSVDEATMEALELEDDTTVDGAVFLGLSTALSGRLVSPINPRALLIGYETFLAFQRGVQQVEIASLDRDRGALNFYLLSFEQICNGTAAGCLPGDLFTPSIERNWLSLTLRDDEELKNTVDDCRQCHQRGRDEPTLLMRELQAPWTHFFGLGFQLPGYEQSEGGSQAQLADDYQLAKGRESYAGLPSVFTRHTAGLFLQNSVPAGQPLLFDTGKIEEELLAATSAPRRSATWDLAYEAFKRGEQLALPHYEPRPTDPVKQARLSEAYARFRAGELAVDRLPDLSDIFPDEPRLRAELGLQVEPDATPAQALVQACGPCHNDVLDQSLSRARFNVDLSRMTRAELDQAVARLELPVSDPGVMPPRAARQLDAQGRARLLAYLRRNERSAEDDTLLGNAARYGMARELPEYPRY